ncbi:MAG: 50S ribosomal protein L11 methyltransferase [Gammaproteobacteria bacterium]|nr:50S ribosomal protein L11 methyltransferase [Gammaproteobacteria bacterium]
MAWLQISVVADQQAAHEVADLFTELGALSVTYMDAEDEPVYEPALNETVIWSHTQVVALYEMTADPVLIKHRISESFQLSRLRHWEFDVINDQVWERAWMEHYHPMKFADRLWVCPTDQERYEKDTVCLTLDPGLAFGTGTHPTTALCLDWLARQNLRGKTIVDFGCGSGILAIASLLLGAENAYAVDIDPQAITATQNNAEKNKVQDKLISCLPEQFAASDVRANVVVANILAKPLIDMASHISNLLIIGGQLVLSGILAEQKEDVVAGYNPFIMLNCCVQQEEWVRLAGTKH